MADRLFDGARRWVGNLIRERAFSLYFALSLGYNAVNDGYHRMKYRRRNDVQPLSALDVGSIQSSDTVFILGSGASVNAYDDAQWARIDAHDSIGFNFWPIHEFVPTYYVGELPEYPSWVQLYHELLEQRAEDYANVPFVMKSIHGTTFGLEVDGLPLSIRSNVYVPITLAVPGDRATRDQFERSIRYLDQMGIFDPKDQLRFIFHKRSSVVDLLLLACTMGYKQIVLSGVDFNKNVQFYIDERERYESMGRPIPDETIVGTEHLSMDPEVGQLSAIDYIEMVNDLLLAPRNIDLHVGTTNSALHPKFPYHFGDG